MAKFNKNVAKRKMNETKNHEGATVHQLNSLEILFSKVLGSFFGESTHYENRSADTDMERLIELMEDIPERDKEYALKIVQLGRMTNMISYPLNVLTVALNMERYKGEAFLDENGKNKMAYYIDEVVRRTKDVNEILATQLAVYGRDVSLPKQLRKGLKIKLESYDTFKLSKGLNVGNEVSLRDAIKLLRPKPANKEMEDFYKAVIRNRVKVGNNEKKQITTELTKKGQRPYKSNKDLTKAVFESNLQVVVKNLVTLLNNGIFEDKRALEYVVSKLRDKNSIKHSKLLPFRFFSAYRELEKLGSSYASIALKEALEDAVDISVENVDDIEGFSAVLIDRSGSMRRAISERSAVTAEDMALLLGAIAYKKSMGDLFVFGTSCQRISVSRRTPVFEIMKTMKNAQVGGSTQLKTALAYIEDYAKGNSIKYDNLIFLSDNDCYGYDSETGVLTLGEHRMFLYTYKTDDTAEKQINRMIADGVIRKLWINNLLGNEFVVANTNSHSKNLATGFSENFINIINVYNYLGTGKNIKKAIDMLLKQELSKKRK